MNQTVESAPAMNLDPVRQEVVKALENPNYVWRTPQGISNETGLAETAVTTVLSQMSPDTLAVASGRQGKLYTTRDHYFKPNLFGGASSPRQPANSNRVPYPVYPGESVHLLQSANVWLGFLGGLVPGIVKVISWAQTDRPQRPPIPLRDPAFWLLFILLPTVGGFVVGLYEFFGTKFNGPLAFQVGITAPVFLQQLAASASPLGKGN